MGGLLIAAVIVVPLTLTWSRVEDDYAAAKAFPRSAAAYRAAGFPWTAAELVAPVKPEDNAAPYLRLAVAQVKSIGAGRKATDKKLDLGNPERSPEVVRLLEPAMHTALYASKLPALDFQRDWDAGPTLLFPEYSYLKTICRGLCARAEDEATRGDLDGCTRDLLGVRRISALLAGDPIPISVLVQISCDNAALTSIQRCAERVSGKATALRALQAVLDVPVKEPDFFRALRGEAYMQLSIIRSSQAQRYFLPDARVVIREAVPGDVKLKASLDRALEAWTRIGEAERRSHQNLRAVAKVAQRIADDLGSRNTTSYFEVGQIFPQFSAGADELVADKALNIATRALLAALIHKADTGKFPPRLSDMPGKWIDPFTGEPLHYKLTESATQRPMVNKVEHPIVNEKRSTRYTVGWTNRPPQISLRVYSVGPNERDDNGISQAEQREQGRDKDFDIVAAYPAIRPKTW